MTSKSPSEVIYGADLNDSKSPLDKKEYRQIILKENGLRVILISDTDAMLHQDIYEYDDGDYEEEDEEKKEENHGEGDSDEETDDEEEEEDGGLKKAAAAVVVGAGSFHDPPFAQGMAHFLEHMLFMGTEKYPAENQYDAFLSKHSGSDNAYTELEYTLYYMEICQEKFFEALDMLAQFFISPLLKEDAVDRELNAIESEFQLSKNSDECRLQQLLCHDCFLQEAQLMGDGVEQEHRQAQKKSRRRHPFANFSWGNKESLRDVPAQQNVDMMTELRNFYNAHYYAQNMSLVVIGAYTLDRLEKEVVERFRAIPALPRFGCDGKGAEYDSGKEENNHALMETFHRSMSLQRTNGGTWDVSLKTNPVAECGMPFQTATLGRITRIVPVKEKHSLSITWQVPPQWDQWEAKPCDYLAHLLGHEAKGSLLSALKAKSWVNGCYAGVGSGGYEHASSHALFCLTYTLSEEGVEHWAEIVEITYVYLGMIRHYCCSAEGLPSWIHDELRSVQEIAHKFQDEMTPVDLVESIAACLAPINRLPPERLLDGDALLFKFNGDAIKNLVENYFTPQHARLDLMSSTFGRAGDFEEHITSMQHHNDVNNSSNGVSSCLNSLTGDAIHFARNSVGDPYTEPIFGTKYWSHRIPSKLMDKWEEARTPRLPPPTSQICLPPVNPFIPTRFNLRDLPQDDAHHPLLFCSLKICVKVGKKKAWFPCTVNKYDGTKNRVLLTMEDGEEVWYPVDWTLSEFKEKHKNLSPNSEGTLDKKQVKYKVISVPKDGEGAVMKYGDDSDWHIEDGIHFPHIPPPLPESRLPKLVFNTQLLKLWHLQDRKFKRPIAELRLRIICANANKTPFHRACAELLCILLHDATLETCYLASVCELENEISATDVGFTLRVHGFDDKILDLASEILETFFSFCGDSHELPPAVKRNRFDACLEILRRRYGNTGLKASSLSSDIRLRCIRPTIWSAAAKAVSIRDINEQKFMEGIANIMTKVSMEGLYHGNVDNDETDNARKIILNAAEGLRALPKKQYPKQFVSVLPLNGTPDIVVPALDPKEPNSAVEVYYQCGKDDLKERVIVDLLMEIMYEPMFNQLRTKEQFGYQVSCGSRWTYGIIGMCFKVITNCKSADEVSARIERFVSEFRSELVDMKEETFLEHVVGLAKDKLQRFNSLEEESCSLWSEILENRYDFEVHRNEAEALRQLTKQDIVEAFDKWLLSNTKGTSRRKLTICVIGTADGSSFDPSFEKKSAEETKTKIDLKIEEFHKRSGKQTWGKIF